jgi:pimeloyl-ACP methyl ester carboxylesterase
VVLHGGSGRRQQADGLLALLPQACDVVVPDLRGHGESSHTPGRYRLEDFAGDVASLCDALFDGEPAIIYGHSLGGQVALVLAAERPDLARAVIIGDAPLSLGSLQRATAGWHQVAVTWRALAASGQRAADIAAALEEMQVPAMDGSDELRPAREVFGAGNPYFAELGVCLAAHDPAFLDEVVLARFASTHRSLEASLVTRFKAPVLLIRADPAAGGPLPASEVHQAQQLRPDAQAVITPGVSHALHLQDPAALAAVISPFIAPLITGPR